MTTKPCDVCGTIHGPLESCPSFEKAERIRRMYSGGGISTKDFVKRYSKGDSSQRYTLRGDDVARMLAQQDFADMEARVYAYMRQRFCAEFPRHAPNVAQDTEAWSSAESLQMFEAFCRGYTTGVEDVHNQKTKEQDDGDHS